MKKILTRDTILILTSSFFYMASPMLVTPLITGFSESIGASSTMMGMIGGMMYLCSLICRPFMGNLSDKISKYKLSFIGAFLVFVSCLGYVLVNNTTVLFALRLVNGIGYSCCSVCMSTWMSQLLPRENIGSGMGLYGTVNALSMAIAPAIGVTLRNAFGYHIAFGMAVVFAIGTMIVIQFVHDKGFPEVKEEKKHKLEIIDINVLPITLTILFFTIPYCVTQSFLVNYVEARHLNVPVSLFFPAYAAFLLILRLSLKNLFDKLPFWLFIVVGNVSALLSMVCLMEMKGITSLLLAALFMAGGYGTMCTVCQSTAILIAGKGKQGLANSTYYIGLDLGMTVGPIIGGIVFGQISITHFYPVFMIMVPLCFVVYWVANKWLNKNSVRENCNA